MRDTFTFLIFAAPLGLCLVIAGLFLPRRRGRLMVTGIVLMMAGTLAFGVIFLLESGLLKLNIIQ